MTLKSLYAFCIAAVLMVSSTDALAQKRKTEIKLGYGQLGFYQLSNRPPYNTSTGAFCMSLGYYVSRSVTVGVGLGYENISNWASVFTVAPEVTFKYMDTRNTRVRVRLYGAASWGISGITDLHVGKGEVDESGAKPWGFQVTPIGVRIGRTWAGFCELGMGYKGLVHGGITVRFPRYMPRRDAQKK